MFLKDLPVSIDIYRGINILVLVLFLCLLSSCVTKRKAEYLQDKNENIKAFNEADFTDYNLKPNDELYIQVSSLDVGIANPFSNVGNQSSSGAGGLSPYGASLVSYTIDKDGFLLLPFIGNIFVKDKTLSQVSLILRDSLNNILNNPIISIKLVNRYISVLGEVTNPGHYPYAQEKLSIFNAVGLAGDITDYGNRNQVLLIRNENGKNMRIQLDLSKSDILSSDYFNLRPNDIVYVRPRSNKFWIIRQVPLNLLISSITTALLIYSIIDQP